MPQFVELFEVAPERPPCGEETPRRQRRVAGDRATQVQILGDATHRALDPPDLFVCGLADDRYDHERIPALGWRGVREAAAQRRLCGCARNGPRHLVRRYHVPQPNQL